MLSVSDYPSRIIYSQLIINDLATCNMTLPQLHVRQADIARQEARLKMEKDNLEKEKSVLMGTASSQDNQDGALEITVSGEKYRCLRFSKAKK
jgi:hypothetical protein